MHCESLHRLLGISRSQASLLIASGVHTPEDLSKNHPEKLLRWMAEVNTEQRLVRRLPCLEQVSQWIESTRQLQAV